MNGVIGMTDLLLTTELNEEQGKYAELVKQSGKNLLHVINDILDISKIEAYKIELEHVVFDLRLTAAGVVDLMRSTADSKGVEMICSIKPDVPTALIGDPARLRQVILNLVSNAVKFTEHGVVSLQISKESENDHYVTVCFDVIDSGIGISPDKQGMIFEPFTQADYSTTRRFGGTGLGLAISSRLVELMGGSIGVDSEVGKGSVFRFSAVFEKQDEESGVQTQEVAAAVSNNPSRQIRQDYETSGRILLAEDDPINQNVAKAILAKFGYQCDIVSNGREAVSALENENYALVLMDCMMPEMSGFEATAHIRDETSAVLNHQIPIIALTANSMHEDRSKCFAAGMDDYVSKPFDIAAFKNLLQAWLPQNRTTDLFPVSSQNAVAAEHARIQICDVAELHRRMANDDVLCREVVGVFLEHFPGMVTRLAEALSSQDREQVRNFAHSIKGSAANLALHRLSDSALALEQAAVSGDMDHVQILFSVLESRFSEAEQVLKNMVV
jgi:CheY-like chemotaxis protein/HPt (histidine-containing phosphotransfer) domain-containing protein